MSRVIKSVNSGLAPVREERQDLKNITESARCNIHRIVWLVKIFSLRSPLPGMGGGSLLRMSCMSSVSVELMKGARPMAHSYMTQPRAHRSEAVECVASSEKSSGAM